jgi:hypothetical protein
MCVSPTVTHTCEDMTSSASNSMSSDWKSENASMGSSHVTPHGATEAAEAVIIFATKVTDA